MARKTSRLVIPEAIATRTLVIYANGIEIHSEKHEFSSIADRI